RCPSFCTDTSGTLGAHEVPWPIYCLSQAFVPFLRGAALFAKPALAPAFERGKQTVGRGSSRGPFLTRIHRRAATSNVASRHPGHLPGRVLQIAQVAGRKRIDCEGCLDPKNVDRTIDARTVRQCHGNGG